MKQNVIASLEQAAQELDGAVQELALDFFAVHRIDSPWFMRTGRTCPQGRREEDRSSLARRQRQSLQDFQADQAGESMFIRELRKNCYAESFSE